MTDKEIIIDGIDVTGCEYCSRYADTTIYHCDWIGECKEHPNCYYKQLKRKEQECERLKEENKEIRKYQYEQDFLQQQLDQLKAENEDLKKTVDDLLHKPKIQDKILWKIDNEALLGSKDAWIYKLEQTLAEIKEIAETQQSWNEWNRQFSETESEDDIFAYNWSALKQILQKISEVESELN